MQSTNLRVLGLSQDKLRIVYITMGSGQGDLGMNLKSSQAQEVESGNSYSSTSSIEMGR